MLKTATQDLSSLIQGVLPRTADSRTLLTVERSRVFKSSKMPTTRTRASGSTGGQTSTSELTGDTGIYDKEKGSRFESHFEVDELELAGDADVFLADCSHSLAGAQSIAIWLRTDF